MWRKTGVLRKIRRLGKHWESGIRYSKKAGAVVLVKLSLKSFVGRPTRREVGRQGTSMAVPEQKRGNKKKQGEKTGEGARRRKRKGKGI